MLNKIIIMGRLTRDPELRHTQSGVAVASFSLAVERDFKDKTTGEKTTDFIDVVAWRNTGEFVSRYFAKGRMAVVEGRLQMRDWLDKDQNKRRSAEIVADNVYFGDSKRDGDAGYASGFSAPPPGSAGGGYAPAPSAAPGGGAYAPPAGGGYAPPSDGFGYAAPAGNYQAAPSPAPAPYSAPSTGTGPSMDEFSALAEDDGDLPF